MKYWVFDLDGTLVDSRTVHFQILEKVFAHFEVPFGPADHQEVLKINAKTLPQYFASKLGTQNVQSATDLFDQLTGEAVKTIQPFDGITDLLTALQSRDLKLAVWTARDLKTTKEILKSTGLEDYFSICISATCVEQAKPHPEGLQIVANHFDSKATDMVMVGDFDSDMLGAQAFGTKAIRVLWHPAVVQKKCEIAHWQFQRVSELADWVQKNI